MGGFFLKIYIDWLKVNIPLLPPFVKSNLTRYFLIFNYCKNNGFFNCAIFIFYAFVQVITSKFLLFFCVWYNKEKIQKHHLSVKIKVYLQKRNMGK